MGAVFPRAKSVSSDASNRWRYLATGFLAIALSMLVSCSGGGGNGGKASDTKSPQQGDVATPTSDGRVQAAADEGVLKLEDLPSGWVEAGPSGEDTSDPCGLKELRSRATAWAESAFSKDHDQVSNSVLIYPNDSDADGTVTEFVERMKSCDPEAMLKALSEGAAANVTYRDVTIGRLSFTQLGDRSEALRATVTFSLKATPPDEETTGKIDMDYVLVLSGRTVSALVVVQPLTVTTGLSEEMATRALSKLEEAAKVLSGG